MKISQPKLIFSTRRTVSPIQKETSTTVTQQPSSSTTKNNTPKISFLEKTKSLLNHSSSGLKSSPTTPIPRFGQPPKEEKRDSNLIQNQYYGNENQIRKQSIAQSPSQDQTQTQTQTLDDGLAICLFGYSVQAQTHQVHNQLTNIQEKDNSSSPQQDTSKEDKETILKNPSIPNYLLDEMYDSTYEEEIRQQAVMAEVLPDAEMWAKWEKTEAPLRQGRGWYPRLDRHFLELLVISEIHALSHPISSSPPGTADKVHRHASRVRRVACERIGAERLNAYCERVKEAFEAYMMGGWSNPPQVQGNHVQPEVESEAGALEEEDHEDTSTHEEGEEGQEEERGRSLSKGKGSIQRDDHTGRSSYTISFAVSDPASEGGKGREVELKVPKINIIPSSQEEDHEGKEKDELESELELSEIALSELTERSNEDETSNKSHGDGDQMDIDNDHNNEEPTSTRSSSNLNKNEKEESYMIDLDLDIDRDDQPFITYSSIVGGNGI